jgi:hypothetical protein
VEGRAIIGPRWQSHLSDGVWQGIHLDRQLFRPHPERVDEPGWRLPLDSGETIWQCRRLSMGPDLPGRPPSIPGHLEATSPANRSIYID